MRTQVLILSLLAITISANSLRSGYITQDHPFGAVHLKRETDEGFHSIVDFPDDGLFTEQAHFDDHLVSLARKKAGNDDFLFTKQDAILTCDAENKSKYFKFLPIHIATLKPGSPAVTYEAHCFKKNELKLVVKDEKTVELIQTVSEAANIRCSDGYLFSSVINYHLETVFTKGKHVVTFKVSPKEMELIKKEGIFVFRMCDKTMNFIPSILKTLSMFVGGFGLNPYIPFFGGRPMKYQVKNSIDFIYQSTGHLWEKRPKDEVVHLEESELQSGDFLAVTRFDGIDQIIQWGTGSHVGHSTMILKHNGTTYVVESQDGWYWPKHGIQINTYKDWIKWARNAGFMVTLVPLKKEIAAKFNSEAAYKRFKEIEGTPYGFHNFILGWIDTTEHSLPHLLEPEFVAVGFAIVEKIIPKAVDSLFNEAMNKRLGTKGLRVAELVEEAHNQGKTMPELYAEVEKDSTIYSDGVSLVCSSFVISMYKAGGLFEGFDVQATEFTPRDLYELNFFDPNPVVPERCRKLDPENPFCQIMGDYRLTFPKVSTVAPYNHMNEKCYSVAPKFERFPANC